MTLEIRIGVNTGEVLAATDPRPGEPMVTGDAVNVAARLEQAADPGEILVAERTARAARGFRFRRARRAGAPRQGASRSPPSCSTTETAVRAERGVPGLRAPMVGRDRELELLRSLYQRSAEEGRPNLVTIYGDPGVGKSRLVAEFVGWAEGLDPAPTIVRGRCLPYGDGVTFWPLAEILKGLASIRDTDPPEVALERIQRLGRDLITTDVAAHPEKATAALAYTRRRRGPGVLVRTLEPREVSLKIHARVALALLGARAADSGRRDRSTTSTGRTRRCSTCWRSSPSASSGPVRSCARRGPSSPSAARDGAAASGTSRRSALDPLTATSPTASSRLLLSVADLPGSVHDRILERAEGNPFFLEEIVRHLIDEG